jgi:hypothetical protein
MQQTAPHATYCKRLLLATDYNQQQLLFMLLPAVHSVLFMAHVSS